MQILQLHIKNFKSIREMAITDIEDALILWARIQERLRCWMPSVPWAEAIRSLPRTLTEETER